MLSFYLCPLMRLESCYPFILFHPSLPPSLPPSLCFLQSHLQAITSRLRRDYPRLAQNMDRTLLMELGDEYSPRALTLKGERGREGSREGGKEEKTDCFARDHTSPTSLPLSLPPSLPPSPPSLPSLTDLLAILTSWQWEVLVSDREPLRRQLEESLRKALHAPQVPTLPPSLPPSLLPSLLCPFS